jgi:two-component system OmpR family response regulator
VPHRISALLIDDDARLGALVTEYLGKHDIDVTVAGDGPRGLTALNKRRPELVLLDLMLPGMDGLEVCRRIRATPDLSGLPIIMLTAKGEDVDKVVGLELGADDYLAELVARVRAVLRRTSPAATPPPPKLRVGRLELDFASREVTVSGKRRVLTHHEFELLATLARAAGRVLTREQILDALKGQAEAFDRSIDVHIAKLRAKLELDPKEPRYIKTVRGVGYMLAGEAD